MNRQKKLKRHYLSAGERKMVKNVYEGILQKCQDISVEDAVEMCGFFTKVGIQSYSILHPKRRTKKQRLSQYRQSK